MTLIALRIGSNVSDGAEIVIPSKQSENDTE